MTRDTLNQLIQRREAARAQQDQGLLQAVREDLLRLLAAHPEVPEIHYQTGIAHDNSGLGRGAIPHYEKALSLGLGGADRERCLMGLGSTYRYWGFYEKAVETLRTGLREFPQNRAIQVFLAMALYNSGQAKEALQLTIANLMDGTTDEKLLYFKRGILAYNEDLDERAEG